MAAVMTQDRTEIQRFRALAKANEMRLEAAFIRRDLQAMSQAEGCRLVASLLVDAPDVVLSMRIGHLLRAIRRFGDAKVGSFLHVADVRSCDRRVRDLTVRQRRVLAGALRLRAERARRSDR